MEEVVINEKTLPGYSRYSNFYLTQIPAYLAYLSLDNLEKIYKIRENVIFNLTCGNALTHRENNIATRFNQLASEVIEDCMMVSSPTQIALHPSYQEIIGMGEKVLSLLIRKLDETPIFWFWALEAIAGLNPVPKPHRGNIPEMVKDWKEWINANNYD
jgi:hypothetical protein